MDQAQRVRPIVAFPQYLLHLVHSTQQAVAEMGFEFPTLRPVVVEQGFVPSQVFVVAELGFECPMYCVVDLVGSKNLRLVYFPVDSIQVVGPVVPDVANLKMPQYLPFSSFR